MSTDTKFGLKALLATAATGVAITAIARVLTSQSKKVTQEKLQEDARIYEYSSAANPELPPVPVLALNASEHQQGKTRIIPFDLSKQLGVTYPATSPNLMSSFLKILAGESLQTKAVATSQAFYVIRGEGVSHSDHGDIKWAEGDLFVLPATSTKVTHDASIDTAIYWVTDEPLMRYLGVGPTEQKFQPTMFKKERMLEEVENISHRPGAEHLNRLGVLLGNKVTENSTKTLTHVLWSLLNRLPPKDAQRPHRHQSVALDLCVSSSATDTKGVYTLMGPELDADGWVKDPIRCDWVAGSVFVTPPGWWHSHHNETDEPAWVLPMQDAGLYTYQRSLDIRFATA